MSDKEELCYKPVLSKYFTSFSGVCRREEFRGAFWRMLWRSIVFSLISVLASVIAFSLYTFSAVSDSVVRGYDENTIEKHGWIFFTILIIFVFIIWYKLVGKDYYQALSKRLHAFGKSATYWFVIPAVFCNLIDFFVEIGYVSGYVMVIVYMYNFYLFIICFFCEAEIDKKASIKYHAAEIICKANTKKRVLKKKKPVSSTVHSETPVRPTMPVEPERPVKPTMPVKPVKPIPPNFNK